MAACAWARCQGCAQSGAPRTLPGKAEMFSEPQKHLCTLRGGSVRPALTFSCECSFQAALGPILANATCLGGLVSDSKPETSKIPGSNCYPLPEHPFRSCRPSHQRSREEADLHLNPDVGWRDGSRASLLGQHPTGSAQQTLQRKVRLNWHLKILACACPLNRKPHLLLWLLSGCPRTQLSLLAPALGTPGSEQ